MEWLDIKEFIKDTLGYVILIITILLLSIYVVGLQQVVGPSMSNTFTNGDIIILDKISYNFIDVKRNDIISFYSEETKYLIKRVIGVPGDYIEFKNNKLYINNIKVTENYLSKDTITKDFSLLELGYAKIPDDMYFVLGDNRENSKDSRNPEIGLIKKEDIIGKVRLNIWPLNKLKVIK